MKVIFINKTQDFCEKINVKSGYARNYLIPYGKAVLANKKNVKRLEKSYFELQSKIENIQTAAKNRAIKIKELNSITISSKTGREGKLFGSIGVRDISNAIRSKGIEIHKNEVRLQNGVLRNIGDHQIKIHIYKKIFVKLNVKIIPK